MVFLRAGSLEKLQAQVNLLTGLSCPATWAAPGHKISVTSSACLPQGLSSLLPKGQAIDPDHSTSFIAECPPNFSISCPSTEPTALSATRMCLLSSKAVACLPYQSTNHKWIWNMFDPLRIQDFLGHILPYDLSLPSMTAMASQYMPFRREPSLCCSEGLVLSDLQGNHNVTILEKNYPYDILSHCSLITRSYPNFLQLL